MISIQIEVENSSLDDEEAVFEKAARTSLEIAQSPLETDLTIVLTGDEQLRALNLQYLGIDAPTDVLSFADGQPDPDTGIPYLGDILISVPRARFQAEAGGHPVRDELRLLIVHGVLHLLGHDHAEEAEKARMWSTQSEILRRLGISLTPPA